MPRPFPPCATMSSHSSSEESEGSLHPERCVKCMMEEAKGWSGMRVDRKRGFASAQWWTSHRRGRRRSETPGGADVHQGPCRSFMGTGGGRVKRNWGMGLGEEGRRWPAIGKQWGTSGDVVERISSLRALLSERRRLRPTGDVQGREVTVRRCRGRAEPWRALPTSPSPYSVPKKSDNENYHSSGGSAPDCADFGSASSGGRWNRSEG